MDAVAADPYNLATHLQMMQGIISRLAQDSFLLKGWSVTLVTALFAFAARDKDDRIAYLALLPAIAFWLLDAYYLWQERMFRDLYKAACEGRLPRNYAMDFPAGVTSRTYFDSLVSVTELGFHGPLLAVVVLLLVLIYRRP